MESILNFEPTSLKDSENFFPKRSGINTTGQKLELAANYFRFKLNDPKRQVFYKYSFKIEPEIPGDSKIQRRRLYNRVKTVLKEKLGHTIFNNTVLYSLQNHEDLIEVHAELQDSEYKLLIETTNTIEAESQEAESLYKKFLSEMTKKINFVQLRKNFYNSSQAHFISNKLEVWPGFNPHVNSTQQGIMLNINLIYRVIRPERAIDVMKNIPNLNDREAKHMEGTAVLTRYNGDRVHILEGIDLEKTPQSKFLLKENEISYLEYYDKKYGIKIQDKSQPLLKCKYKEQLIYLIPELCHITGLTEEMRANFNLMKELSEITKGNAAKKLEECRGLINQFKNNQECQKSMEEWGLTISNEPIKLNAVRITSGNYVMHMKPNNSRHYFQADDSSDIDRKIQTEMYQQPELKTWAIFATSKDQQHAKTFKDTMLQVFTTFKYPGHEPAVFIINSQNYRDWETEIEKQIKPRIQNVQAVVLIIPGSRGKGHLYNDLKKLLLGKYPVPNQVVLSGTIAKGKGVRSIVNKILIQICAKTGGVPWAIDSMPFSKYPTMVCGVDMFQSAGKKSILGFTASMDNNFAKYHSIARIFDESNRESAFSECFKEALQKFPFGNKLYHVIIIRDGIAPTQMRNICTSEVGWMKKVLKELNFTCKITYTLLNKKTNLKLFANNCGKVDNAPPGTIVDSGLTSNELNDFYLIPAKSNQGLASSTHYQIVYDDAQIKAPEFHSLVYKLCYLYYNWTGSIKVPAPCQYAKKLVTLLGEKLSDRNNTFLPNSQSPKLSNNLYYL